MWKSPEKVNVFFEAGMSRHRARKPLPSTGKLAAIEVEAAFDEILEQFLPAGRARMDESLENLAISAAPNDDEMCIRMLVQDRR